MIKGNVIVVFELNCSLTYEYSYVLYSYLLYVYPLEAALIIDLLAVPVQLTAIGKEQKNI
jgi:hypothetical protein